MYSGGYAGRVLRINLSNKTSREEPSTRIASRGVPHQCGSQLAIRVMIPQGVDSW
jgi:hypothetical protein